MCACYLWRENESAVLWPLPLKGQSVLVCNAVIVKGLRDSDLIAITYTQEGIALGCARRPATCCIVE